MVWALWTMTWEGLRRPFSLLGWMVIRNSGASLRSPVTGRMVTDGCASKRSDWTISAGRGLP